MTTEKTELRKQAEEIVREKVAQSPKIPVAMSPEEIQQTIHELRVHQIELEMQNDELQRAHVELDAVRTRYFELYDLAPVGYLTVNKQGLILEANLKAANILGVARSALSNRPLARFILKEDQDIYYLQHKQLFDSDEPQKYELRMVKNDGAAFWSLLETTTAQEADGISVCCVVFSDITERKQAEEALQESEEKFRILTILAPDGIYLTDPEGNCLYTNPRWNEMAGFSHQEALGTGWVNALHQEDRETVLSNWEKMVESEGNWGMEYRFQTPEGKVTWVYGLAIPQKDISGKIIRFVGFNTDITARKRADEDNKKLEAQNRQLQKSESLGRMAGAIAHHFNNQLGVVMGNLEMALSDLPKGAEPVNSLNEAMKAASKAAEMSGLMLTYLGHSPGKREQLDLSESCLLSLPLLQTVMPGNVVLETVLHSPGSVISANANQIQQVLTNLITNAREAIGEDEGTIHLGVKTVSHTDIQTLHRLPSQWLPQDKNYVCLEVTDTGCGIEDDDIEKIFDPFYSSKFTGRGLGLAVSIGIVKSHNGAISVESELGRGSTFRVFLPALEETIIRQTDITIRPQAMKGGGTVLLVEDEDMVRNMAAAMLKRLGFAVLEAKDGVEAIDVFQQQQDEIICVLSDLTMPRMNGWETLTALRKLAPDIPVILASGYDEAHVMAGDHPELPQVFLGKPYKLKELSSAISEALVGRK